MIDNPGHVARLLAKMTAALPLAAKVRGAASTVCAVTYGGEDDGVICHLTRGDPAPASQLRFDPRHPLTREIILYQKRRTKRIRRQA